MDTGKTLAWLPWDRIWLILKSWMLWKHKIWLVPFKELDIMQTNIKEFVTTGIIRLGAGLIKLDKKQAAGRLGKLKNIKNDLYEITGHVEFKAGEVISLDPDKATLARLELSEKGLAQEKAEKEAERGTLEAKIRKELEAEIEAAEKAQAEADAKAKADAGAKKDKKE
ncbi:MAG: hypothetical protein KAI40_03365 [Desulfobacterales bacterium]|nr:hypothetical protein [Desulfobacterales bacterium]